MSTTDTLFMAGDRVTVDGYDGVAWRVTGPELVWEPEMFYVEDEDGDEVLVEGDGGEWVDGDGSRLVCVMIGDDRDFSFDAEDLTPIPDDQDICSCGQTGCGW